MSRVAKKRAAGGQAKRQKWFVRPEEVQISELQEALADLKLEKLKTRALEAHVASGAGIPAFCSKGCTYSMQNHEDKLRLATDLWSEDYTPFMSKLREGNARAAPVRAHAHCRPP